TDDRGGAGAPEGRRGDAGAAPPAAAARARQRDPDDHEHGEDHGGDRAPLPDRTRALRAPEPRRPRIALGPQVHVPFLTVSANGTLVMKFGGTSVADAERIKR